MHICDYTLELKTILSTEPDLHQGIECLLVLGGELDISIGVETFHLLEEEIVVINHNQLHAISGNPDNLVLHLHVEEDFLKRECGALASNILMCNGAALDIVDDKTYFELKRILIKMYMVKLDKPYGYSLNLNMNLLRFLHLLYTTYSDMGSHSTAEHSEAGGTTHPQTVLEYVRQNCHRSLTLQQTADYFHLSPAYFSKYFKKNFGIGYLQYLQKVRTEKSMSQLLHSNDSIMQISLDCGFGSPKAYADNFFKHYGEYPSQYRKRYQVGNSSAAPLESALVFEEAAPENAKLELLRYIKKYNMGINTLVPVDENHEVLVTQQPLCNLQRMENLLIIDNPYEALRMDFDQYLDCRERFNIQYAYFQLMDNDMEDIEYGIQSYHRLVNSVKMLCRYGLVPFIRLVLPNDSFTGNAEDMLMYLKQKLFPLLETLRQSFPVEKIRHWRFEIVCSNLEISQAEFFYKSMWQLVDGLFSGSQVGLFADFDEDGKINQRFCHLLEYAEKKCMPPTFITFHAFQNRLKRNYPKDALLYSDGKNFFNDIAQSVMVACSRYNVDIPLYMTVWNTITGESPSEISIYLRSALIMEALLDSYNTIHGVGYRFATRNTCPYSGEPYGAPLDLYAFSKAKRPVYYVATMADRLCGALLYRDYRVAVSNNTEGELVVMVWNPQYLNPLHCPDGHLVGILAQQIRVELQGMENRKYTIKRFTIDNDSSGTITFLNRAGFPALTDKDVYDYMENSSGSELYLFSQEVNKGMLVLTSSLQYNGITMYVLK